MFKLFDRSDSRSVNADGRSGSGVGAAPTPSDGRGAGTESQVIDTAYPRPGDRSGLPIGIALMDDDCWPNDRSDARGFATANGPHGSGGQVGSPELEYKAPDRVGYSPVAAGPIDGGLSDPIRRGWTPARAAVTRFFFDRKPVDSWTPGEFGREREIFGNAYRGPQQPIGRMSPMDEYRLLGDGSHA